MSPERARSGAACRDAQPVPVRVDESTLPSSKTLLVDGNTELRGYDVHIVDVQVDQRVGTSIALVFGQVEPHSSAHDGDEPGEAWLELVPPLLLEPEALVPGDGAIRVVSVQDWDDLFFHAENLKDADLRGRVSGLRKCS